MLAVINLLSKSREHQWVLNAFTNFSILTGIATLAPLDVVSTWSADDVPWCSTWYAQIYSWDLHKNFLTHSVLNTSCVRYILTVSQNFLSSFFLLRGISRYAFLVHPQLYSNYIWCLPQPIRSDTLASNQWLLPRHYLSIVALTLLLQSQCSYPTSILGYCGVEDS